MEGAEHNGVSDRLRDPEIQATLHRLLDRLGDIDRATEQLAGVARSAPDVVSMVTDTVDEMYRDAEEAGLRPQERIEGVVNLLQRLSEPRTLDALTKLVDRLPLIEELVAVGEQLPGMLSMIVDSVDELAMEADQRGINIGERIKSTYMFGDRLTAPDTVEALRGVLDPGAVRIVGMGGAALVRCQQECFSQEDPPTIGLVGLMRAFRSPERRRALAFLSNFARFFGEMMEEAHAEHRRSLAQNKVPQ